MRVALILTEEDLTLAGREVPIDQVVLHQHLRPIHRMGIGLRQWLYSADHIILIKHGQTRVMKNRDE